MTRVLRIEETREGVARVLSELVHLLPGIVESVANVLTKVLELLAHVLANVGEGLLKVLTELSDLFKPVGGRGRRGALIGDRVGDLGGDRRRREIIGENVVGVGLQLVGIGGIRIDTLLLVVAIEGIVQLITALELRLLSEVGVLLVLIIVAK